MALNQKNEAKIYFLSHNESIKEVASKFNIPYRTFAHWVATEKWEAGSAIAGIAEQHLQKDIVKKEFGSVMQVIANDTKNQIKRNLGDDAFLVDEMILNNILKDSTDKILTNAINLNYIQKNIALSAVIARNELLKMLKLAKAHQADPTIIAAAEKVQKIFLDLKDSSFGKNYVPKDEKESINYEELSNEELERILKGE